MALLTALILGGILLGVLGRYYRNAEEAYLRAGAQMIAGESLPLRDQAALNDWALSAALTTDTRVRVFDVDGALLVDSGSPLALDADALLGPRMGMGDGSRHRDRMGMPNPLGGGLFGSASGSRSDRTLNMSISGGSGEYVQISEAPVSGSAALASAAQAWALAAALAVALAALAGYLVSRRISRPVVALTAASDRMAEGDLSARAPVVGNDEVGRLGESFNTMAARIETTVSALRRFIADAAHEIGTPLTALQADLELAQRAATTDDEKRLVGRSLEQARRLEDLSAGLLELSRLEAAAPPAQRGGTDAAALAHAAADAVASRAEQAGVELDVRVADEQIRVAAGPAELETILGNLLDNALKFTPEGGTVTLGLQTEGGSAVLTVADTGVGIPVGEQAQIFSRFHRARNVAEYPGSGLGLAIVKAAVERAGGAVSFTSSPAGTQFRVSLPTA
jgi:signal transduction histidine kinase